MFMVWSLGCRVYGFGVIGLRIVFGHLEAPPGSVSWDASFPKP